MLHLIGAGPKGRERASDQRKGVISLCASVDLGLAFSERPKIAERDPAPRLTTTERRGCSVVVSGEALAGRGESYGRVQPLREADFAGADWIDGDTANDVGGETSPSRPEPAPVGAEAHAEGGTLRAWAWRHQLVEEAHTVKARPMSWRS